MRMFTRELEGLSALMRRVERLEFISGIRCGRFGPRISHLFFTDDSLLISRARIFDCDSIKGILATYSCALGQLINFDKSLMSFSPQVRGLHRHILSGLLGLA
ncbi:hypothetical protein ACOSP7_024099 [Xanthoceras sorbifolium]